MPAFVRRSGCGGEHQERVQLGPTLPPRPDGTGKQPHLHETWAHSAAEPRVAPASSTATSPPPAAEPGGRAAPGAGGSSRPRGRVNTSVAF